MRAAAAVVAILVLGAAFGSVSVGDAASAACTASPTPTPNPSQTSSSIGVRIDTPSDSPGPSETCEPGASPTPEPPKPEPTGGGMNAGNGGGRKGAGRAGPASSNTPQAAPAGAAGAPNPGVQPVVKADPLTITPKSARAGAKVFIAAVGYAAGEKVQVVLYPSPVIIGSYAADSSGALRVTFTVPIETKTGPHTVEATGWISHHATNGSLVVVSAVEAFDVMSSYSWPIGALLLLLLLIVVSVIVFRSTIARMFTSPRAPEPAS